MSLLPKIERKPGMFYFVGKDGQIAERPAGRKKAAGEPVATKPNEPVKPEEVKDAVNTAAKSSVRPPVDTTQAPKSDWVKEWFGF